LGVAEQQTKPRRLPQQHPRGNRKINMIFRLKFLLKLARRRSMMKRRSKALKNLAAISIITKLYMHVKGGGHDLAKLPACLRELLLLELVKRRSKQIDGEEQKRNLPLRKAVHLLISSETKKFEFGGLISFSKMNNVLLNTFKILRILERAPNLQHLILNVEERMDKLKIFKNTHFCIKYGHTKSICKVLKNLQCVEFFHIDFSDMRLEDLGADIEDFKLSFSRLTEFLFQPREIICKFQTDLDCGEALIEESWIPAEPCALRHLCISPSTSDLPAVFPEVTNLQVYCAEDETEDKEDKFKSMLRFSGIECLLLNNLPTFSILERFIGAYGANLHTLMIYVEEDAMAGKSLSFSGIFASCPKLQKMQLLGVDISDDREAIDLFAPLREFEWTPYNIRLQKFEVTNILSALPNLEKFTLFGWEYLAVDDLKKLTSNIAHNMILDKLTTIKLLISHDTEDIFEVPLLLAVRNLIAITAAFLPALVDIEFNTGYMESSSFDEDHIVYIGETFQEWIGEGSIANFIRAIKNRN
ncbi:Hypothetical predicted protein, partial [Cloeon dipterum]